MTAMPLRRLFVAFLPVALLYAGSCTRKNIEFGDNPENNYTNIVYTDTVTTRLSTVIKDSFETNGATSFLLGRYKDPYLGIVSAKNFFQMTIPASIPDIPATAQFDSLTFIFYPNHYYYGDTSRLQTFTVNELGAAITYSYNSKLYNTSDVMVKATLGSKMMRLRPHADDSVIIRLSNTKGMELFEKLRQSSTEVTNSDEFLNYFKGISLSTGTNDTAAIYGLYGDAGKMIMRVNYHTTIPYPEKQSIDFTSFANDYSFNQVIADRTGTGLVTGSSGLTEISSEQTNDLSFSQPGTGVYMKMIFPSLKSIIAADKITKLLKAELIIRPAYSSFDRNKYPLPDSLYLVQTDQSNLSGIAVADSTGSAVQYANPVIDELYGENTYYRFNITSYINQILNATGSEGYGFFLMNNTSPSTMNVNRLVGNNSLHDNQSTKLLLQLVTINK